jgi:hypothetical protein
MNTLTLITAAHPDTPSSRLSIYLSGAAVWAERYWNGQRPDGDVYYISLAQAKKLRLPVGEMAVTGPTVAVAGATIPLTPAAAGAEPPLTPAAAGAEQIVIPIGVLQALKTASALAAWDLRREYLYGVGIQGEYAYATDGILIARVACGVVGSRPEYFIPHPLVMAALAIGGDTATINYDGELNGQMWITTPSGETIQASTAYRLPQYAVVYSGDQQSPWGSSTLDPVKGLKGLKPFSPKGGPVTFVPGGLLTQVQTGISVDPATWWEQGTPAPDEEFIISPNALANILRLARKGEKVVVRWGGKFPTWSIGDSRVGGAVALYHI